MVLEEFIKEFNIMKEQLAELMYSYRIINSVDSLQNRVDYLEHTTSDIQHMVGSFPATPLPIQIEQLSSRLDSVGHGIDKLSYLDEIAPKKEIFGLLYKVMNNENLSDEEKVIFSRILSGLASSILLESFN